MARYIRRDGLVLRVGSSVQKWWTHNRFRLTGQAARFKHPRNLRARTVSLAGHFVGVKEYPAGSNLQEFGRWYGENGVPWCAIFISYILTHAGRPFRYSYVPAIVSDARAAKHGLRPILLKDIPATLKAGFPVLACFDWPPRDGTADHVGLVAGVSGSTIHTIEGNTGNSDWSNGGEVLRESRDASLVELFVKVI